MKVPISWLSEFIDIRKSPEEVAEIFTMGGIEVEALENPYKNLGDLITVKIVEVSEPEDLKEMVVCKVTDGKEIFTVLTTAKDQVRPGLTVGLAKPGSSTFSGEKVEEKIIKKFKSSGMFVSPYEAGLGEEKNILLFFEKEVPLGKSIYEVLNVSEVVLDLAVTPNRGDVLSILGAARELHLLTDWEIKYPNFEDYLKGGKYFKGKIEIVNQEGCFRYIGRVFENVEVKESPFEIQKKLWLCGLRPINNIVDITNYVLLEFGQPLHAFDWDKIKDQTILVRNAYPGEKLSMLDGVERTLSEEDLVIADAEKALVLAGIMGGEESGVSEKTKNVFLEAAWFNPKKIRRSSQRHKLITESSYRFERNIDPEGMINAVLKASQMLIEIGKATRFSEIIDVYPRPYNPPQISLSYKRVVKYLGFEPPLETTKKILKKVGYVRQIGESLEIIPFSYRQDLKIPEDLIEEIARIYGYEKIPNTLPKAVLSSKGKDLIQKFEKKIKEILKGWGFFEVISYSFIDPRDFEKLQLKPEDPRRNFLEIANPLSLTQSVMRTTLIPGLINIACYNYFREVTSLKVFEIGKVFFPTNELLAFEPLYMGLLVMGKEEEEWYQDPQKFDIYHLKGYLENMFEILRIEVDFKPYSEEPFLKKGFSYDLFLKGEKIGFAGEVKQLVLKEFDLKTNVLVAEINLEKVFSYYKEILGTFLVKKPPKFPSTSRDVTCILKKEIPIKKILEFVEKLEIPYLEKVKCIRIYEGPPIPQGFKSISLRFWYRAEDRTLTDEEINVLQEKVAKKIFETFDAKPR